VACVVAVATAFRTQRRARSWVRVATVPLPSERGGGSDPGSASPPLPPSLEHGGGSDPRSASPLLSLSSKRGGGPGLGSASRLKHFYCPQYTPAFWNSGPDRHKEGTGQVAGESSNVHAELAPPAKASYRRESGVRSDQTESAKEQRDGLGINKNSDGTLKGTAHTQLISLAFSVWSDGLVGLSSAIHRPQ
jgi:hypothetical protein